MAILQEYKCPCCGGAIAFDASLQKMKCPYCDTEFEMETLAAFDEVLKHEPDSDMRWEKAPGAQWQEGEEAGLRAFACRSCGGEIVGDASMAATACPYCGNPVVVMERFSGSLKPEWVIPFRLDRETAKDRLREHYKGKRLLPKVFMDENRINEIKGVYVPFWLYDAEADAHIRYKATRVRVWSSGSYDYTETSFYSVVREGSLAFANVPVDGSSKMDDALMESIEPYDFSQAVDFQTAYLAGYFADKYDVDAGQSVGRANERIRKSTEEAFAATVEGYVTVTPELSSIRLKNSAAKYALLPVWLLNTTWNGTRYTFAMNGQTGKFVGDLPMDRAAYWRWLLGLTAALSGALWVLSWLARLL